VANIHIKSERATTFEDFLQIMAAISLIDAKNVIPHQV
jgi:hypothetical protein